ncbi:hypothetical protein PAP18089_05307 [Pandoraea apista]|uniref:Uncharacterized protein n=1 Tax=Pandoraea apista TaxID=93218 RepID=A0A5E5PD62_9BURK|nr:hypothetical protein LMG16407_03157 [Pandoraea apista]VVG74294.1 hypothetical protein PAP18089_05307 [Pandoraea apista]
MFTVASFRREASPTCGTHAQQTSACAASQLSVYVPGAFALAAC